MSEFQTPTDIGNRAAQHCGAEMMDPVLGFDEKSKVARQVGFVYGKLRRAELERNVWTFAIRKAPLRAVDANTMLLVPTVWSPLAGYFAGSLVSDINGTIWISRIQNNRNNEPQTSGTWDLYYGPMTVTKFDPVQSYFAGELVYTAAGDGTNLVYLSMQNGNQDIPTTFTPWAATSTYNFTQAVTYLSVSYVSLINLNTNNIPNLIPLFDIGTTYGAGAKVGAVDGIVYQSVGAGNIGNEPTADGGVHWTNTGVLTPWQPGGSTSLKWQQVGGLGSPQGVGLTPFIPVYPVGAGPSSQAQTKNVYVLPANYLREAPQDPKAGSMSWLGAPTGGLYSDWEFENNFITTGSGTGLIIFRFVADIQNVPTMKTMFCEGLAARIAIEVCEALTQSTAKLGAITAAYNKSIGDARTANAIEAGSEEPPLDDWISCRA